MMTKKPAKMQSEDQEPEVDNTKPGEKHLTTVSGLIVTRSGEQVVLGAGHRIKPTEFRDGQAAVDRLIEKGVLAYL